MSELGDTEPVNTTGEVGKRSKLYRFSFPPAALGKEFLVYHIIDFVGCEFGLQRSWNGITGKITHMEVEEEVTPPSSLISSTVSFLHHNP